MSYPSAKIAKDKYITNQILASCNLPVPKELIVDSNSSSGINLAEQFLSENGKVVVKPLDASHGKGITVNVSSNQALAEAVSIAIEASKGPKSKVLVQEQVEGVDIRILCIGYEFVDAISRKPASIVGDGIHTVKELIEITNSDEERGQNYATKLNVIPIDKADKYLGLEAMSHVPDVGEETQAIGVSNVGMGGTRHNIKNDIPDFLKDIAIKCAKELELPCCGVDFMVKRLPMHNDIENDLKPCIMELNECPMLTFYDDFHSKEQNAIIDKYLDYIVSSVK